MNPNLPSFAPALTDLGFTKVFYLRFRLQWMSDGVMSMRGSVNSADRQRWSCRSSLTLCRARSDRRGAPLHPLDFQLGSASALPFSASLCFGGAWKKVVKARIFFFFPPKEDRQGSQEGSLNIYQVQHVTQRSLRHLEPQDLVPPTVQTSSFISNGAVRRDKHFLESSPCLGGAGRR